MLKAVEMPKVFEVRHDGGAIRVQGQEDSAFELVQPLAERGQSPCEGEMEMRF